MTLNLSAREGFSLLSCIYMMLIFAFLTLGYFAGVITALLVFPPKVKEIEMQEQDAAKPVAELEQSKTPQIAPTPAGNKNLIFEI